MPYIKYPIEFSCSRKPECAGDLNYLFSRIALTYIDTKGCKYQNWNDIIGALESCKQEIYRRFIAPYEDQKIKENGDII